MARVTDPGCGMTIESTSAAATAAYQGRTYFFCSTQCLRQFEENPGTYVNQAATGRGPDGGAEARG